MYGHSCLRFKAESAIYDIRAYEVRQSKIQINFYNAYLTVQPNQWHHHATSHNNIPLPFSRPLSITMPTLSFVACQRLLSHEGSKVKVDRVSPFAEAPPSLGADRWTNDRVAACTSHFCQLERPKALPPLSRINRIEEIEVKNAYRRLCSGDFSARWIIHNEDYLILEARLDENDDYSICLVLYDDEIEMGKYTISLRSFYARNTKFVDLCPKQEQNLRERILHQFLRLSGHQLPWRKVKQACAYLYGIYSVKRLEEALDVAIATTDIAINKGKHEEIVAMSMHRVGLCLWALDRPLDAAFVFQEMFQEYPSYLNDEAIQYCADAFSHAGEHQYAENVILSALLSNAVEGSSTWNENELLIFDYMESLLSIYEKWSTFEREHQNQAPMKTMQTVMSALLFSAGCNVMDRHESFLSQITESNTLFLKQKYQTKKQARRTLLNAIRDPKRFRSLILACHDERVKVFVIPVTSSKEEAERLEHRAKKDSLGRSKVLIVTEELTKEELTLDLLHHARETLRRYAGVRSSKVACGNLECDMEGKAMDFSKCPCKRVYYCQKSCQVNHWPAHKANCKFHLQKKRSKTRTFQIVDSRSDIIIAVITTKDY